MRKEHQDWIRPFEQLSAGDRLTLELLKRSRELLRESVRLLQSELPKFRPVEASPPLAPAGIQGHPQEE